MVLFQHSLWVETFLQKIAKTLEVAVYYVSTYSMLEFVEDSNFMLGMQAMVIRVVEFSNGGYKIRKIFMLLSQLDIFNIYKYFS